MLRQFKNIYALYMGNQINKIYKISTIISLLSIAAIPIATATPSLFTNNKINNQQTSIDSYVLAHTLKNALGAQKNRFLFGASTSEHQCSKQCTPLICDWARFAHENNLAKPTDPLYPCDFWNNYETYIEQLQKKLCLNSMRISIEWALVQPNGPAYFDQKTLDHYAAVFICLIQHNITPFICFHHYTSPCWFADMGGFEQIENSDFFATYCAYTYKHIMATVITHLAHNNQFHNNWTELHAHHKEPRWATFNSPEGVAFKGYWTMEAPPANPKKRSLALVSNVLKNMLEGHVRAYLKINEAHKELSAAHGDKQSINKPQIGLLKNITQLDPSDTKKVHRICTPLTNTLCAIGNNLQNECIYNFFTTGTFKTTNIPSLFKAMRIVKPYTNIDAPYSLDWIGLNYYSNQVMHLNKKIKEKNIDQQTDNANYRIYPHGLYRAIHEINERIAQPIGAIRNTDKTPIPIYVTENGIATTDHNKRNRFYHEYITMFANTIQEGLPVYGYLTWTAFDNYEWPKTKYSDHTQTDNRVYGLTTVSPDGKTLTVKTGASYYQDLVYQFMNS